MDTPSGPRLVRWFGGNQIVRPYGELAVGESVVAELRTVVPDAAPDVARREAELAVRRQRPVVDGRPVGRRLFGDAGLDALGVAVDPAAFVRLESRLADLIRTGHHATLTITRTARPSPTAPPHRYTVELTDANGNKTLYTATDLATIFDAPPQTPPEQHLAGDRAVVPDVRVDRRAGRHRVGDAVAAVHRALAGVGGVHLQDGSVRVSAGDGRQVVVPAEVVAQLTSELGQLRVVQEALDAEAVRRVAAQLGQPETSATTRSPADLLRAAPHRAAADSITRRAHQLTAADSNTRPGTPLIAADSSTGPGSPLAAADSSTGPGSPLAAVGGVTRRDEQLAGQPHPAADRVSAGAAGVLESDLGGLAVGDPAPVGAVVVVPTSDGPQHFRAAVGRLRRGRVAVTQIRSGTAQDPHVVTFSAAVPDAQFARIWVHQISHTLQELRSPAGGFLRRIRIRLTRSGPSPLVAAQYNEFRYLHRRWAAADPQTEPQLRNEIEALADAIGKRVRVPPALPWNLPVRLDPRAELRTAITRELDALDNSIAALNTLIDAKETAADAADAEAKKAKEKLAKAQHARDNGAIARQRSAEADRQKQLDLAAWHRKLAGNYQQALANLTAARNGYAALLEDIPTTPPDRLVVDAQTVAAQIATYADKLDKIAPPEHALPSMHPTGRLPHLAELAERLNALLATNNIDKTYTTTELQQLLSAQFARAVTNEGLVISVGAADLRIKLAVDELVEFGDPATKASETISGLFPQSGRRLTTASTSRFGTTFAVPMKALLQMVAVVTKQDWLADLTVKAEVSTGRTRTVSGNAAEFAQTGAVEDNRGESVLYTGKAAWRLDLRIDRKNGWTAGETIAGGSEELQAQVSHAYTVDAAKDPRQDLRLANDRLPPHVLVSTIGMEKLTDDVIADNEDQLAKLGNDRPQVESQLHAVLTNDLPSQLAPSTDHAVLRPLTVDGKPIGHVAVTTTVRYQSVKMVGGPSATHWQETVLIGFSSASTQQTFGASTSVSVKTGYDGAQVHDVAPDGTDVGPTVSGGRSTPRSDALTGGGTSIHVGVQRFTGPTQAYRMVLDHTVTVVLNGKTATTPGHSNAVARVRVRDAYRHGFPVAPEAVHDGGRRIDGDLKAGAGVPGRRLELPAWATDASGRLNAAGPWNLQAVTGGKAAFEAVVRRLAERGFVPPLGPDGKPDLTKLSADPIESHAQLMNLEELREQLSTARLEAGYDIAARDGILVTLTRARTTQATETVVLRIGIEAHAVKPLGVTTDEAVVLLNIGSETAGRTTSRSKGLPWRADPLSMSSPEARASLSYGRQALGRALAWLTGGTVNQVTLIESTSPVAVFEVLHTLTVSEGAETFYTSKPTETARLMIDSDLLPYDDALPPTPGPVKPSLLQRITLLALNTPDFTTKLPKAIADEATALQQLGVFLNPRNLLAHPEWLRSGYRTTLVLPRIGGVSSRIAVQLTGRLENAQLVSVTEGVSGDINLALGSHGTATGRSHGGSTQASAGVKVDAAGGGLNASLGTNGSTGDTEQDIWGVERLTIETGRQYVFSADATLSLAIGDAAPSELRSGTVFQLAEREALRYYAEGELTLPLEQVADAVERFLHSDLTLDQRAATALLTRYRADLAAAERAGNLIPAVSAEHSAAAMVARLRPSPRPRPASESDPASVEHRLRGLLRSQPPPSLDLPEQYHEHLGFTLIESAGHNVLGEVYDVLRKELGIDPEQDPALAQALFVDLAGKRWWGRLEDMLGAAGFSRSYPVGRIGRLSAQQVHLKIRAEFVDDAKELGAAKDVVGIVQRYLYGDRSRSRGSGRSTGMGFDGALDAARSGSAGTDRAEGASAAAGDQTTRLERIAGFDGMTRVGRQLRLRIEVKHDPAPPTRTPLAQRRPRLPVVPRTRELTGPIVQLVPTVALSKSIPPRVVVPGEMQLPAAYHVDGVGPVDGRADLLDVLAEQLLDDNLLGADGMRAHRTELENKLSASARNAEFSRMASPEGFTLAPLEVPGSKRDTVEITIRARVSRMEIITDPFEGELGDVNRHQQTSSTSTTTGRMLPATASGTYTAMDAGAGASLGDQLADTATDVRGARTERSRYEKGKLVMVRTAVVYDLTLTRTRHKLNGSTEKYRNVIPAAGVGRAYLTLYERDAQTGAS